MIHLRVRLLWAVLTRNHLDALTILKEITMADFAALNEAVARVIAKSQADAQALANAQAEIANADAGIQPQIDALTAQIDAVAPAPEPAPVEVAIDPNTGQPVA